MRINAEDPARNFLPAPGTVDALRVPGGPGVRFDTMLYAGYTVPPFYDSLLGKLIVWDEDARRAIARLKRALARTGDRRACRRPSRCTRRWRAMPTCGRARFHTRWLERWLEANGPRLAEQGDMTREVATR